VDPVDSEILRQLTADARLPFRELGTRVGLSANAAAARVRRLQRTGRIRGFTILTGQGTGQGEQVVRPCLKMFIDVRLQPEVTYEHFGASHASGAFPEILDALHLTDSYDCLVHAVVPGAAALDRLVRRLKREVGVAQSLTRLAMRTPPSATPSAT